MQKHKKKSVLFEWDGANTSINGNISAQNNMSDFRNGYNHITQPNNTNDSKQREVGKIKIINRGSDNLAPQKDLELGKRSITHKRIADELSKLVAGKELVFVPKSKLKNADGTATDDQKLELEIANEWLALGLQEGMQCLANGITYFDLACLFIAQKTGVLNRRNNTVKPVPLRFNARASEQIRYGTPEMQDDGRMVTGIHAYHEDWGFIGFDGEYECNRNVPI